MFCPVSIKAQNSGIQNRQPWKGYSLLMPAICVGNVGQLTIDLIVSTTQAVRVGYMYDDSFLPLAGNDPYDETTGKMCRTCTACDVYCCEKDTLIIIQQRTPFIQGKRRQYREKLIAWIKTQGFEKIVIISAMFAHTRIDNQLTGSQYRYLCTPDRESLLTSYSDHIVEMEESMNELGVKTLNMPGSGIVKTLYKDCMADKLAFVAVIAFCSEGDNAPDAIKLANILQECKLIQVQNKQKNWKIPKSWSLNFGNTFEQTLFS